MSIQWEQAQFDRAYSRGYAQRARYYTNPLGNNFFTSRANKLQGRIGNTNNRILVIGCAFGQLLTQLQARGYNNVWGVDASQWVTDNLGTYRDSVFGYTHGKIEDASTRTALQNASGNNNWNYVITDDVVTSYAAPSAELTTLLNVCEGLLSGGQVSGRVVHILSEHIEGDNHGDDQAELPLTWMTLQQWHDIRSTHSWYSNEREVLMYNGNEF